MIKYNDKRPYSDRERIGFSIGLAGENMIMGLIGIALQVYYTDVLFIGPAAVGVMMTIARLWDAVNDPMMGMIVDRTNSKWGKCRPYLRIAPIPLFIISVLCFTNFGLSNNMTLLYAYITYILFGMTYTLVDIPIWGVTARMVSNEHERTKLLSTAKVLANVGMVIPIIAFFFIKDAFASFNLNIFPTVESQGYFFSVLILAAISVYLIRFSFTSTRERVDAKPLMGSLKHNIKLISKNKPFLLLMLSFILNSTRMLLTTATIYFAKWNLGNGTEGMNFILIGGPYILASTLVMFLVPRLTRKFSKKTIYLACCYLGAIPHIILYFTGYENLVILLAGLCVAGAFAGVFNIVSTDMISSTVEYLEYKTGERQEGIIFSGITMMNKFSTSIAVLLCMLVLDWTGYDAEAMIAIVKAGGHVKDHFSSSLNGIYLLLTIIPALGSILCAIPAHFYKFTEKDYREMSQANLKRRQEANEVHK